MAKRREKFLAVVATTPDDSHLWNLHFIQLYLEENGFYVENLGVCTDPVELAGKVRDLSPELVVISTTNGHGAFSAIETIEMLRQFQVLHHSKVVVGGKLTTDPRRAAAIVEPLREAGYAGVFVGDDALSAFQAFLAAQGLRAPRTEAD